MGNKKTLYPNLMAELARQGLSIASLAKKMGMTRSNLAYKIRGDYNFTLKDITKIQEILRANDYDGDYSLDYLFTKGGE
jgi:transcriptional regulator with XRE-family HTH domain